MKFKWRKEAQRKIADFVRGMNAALERDELWRGRFMAHVGPAYYMETFEDGSGGVLGCIVTILDKQTLRKRDVRVTNYDYYYLPVYMNDFIVQDCAVWEENPRPSRDTAIDYTHIHWENLTSVL